MSVSVLTRDLTLVCLFFNKRSYNNHKSKFTVHQLNANIKQRVSSCLLNKLRFVGRLTFNGAFDTTLRLNRVIIYVVIIYLSVV